MMPTDPSSCGLVLLAAGASQRMGRPKQLLPVAGKPLVRHVAESLLAGSLRPVVVVLGAHAAEVAAALDGLDVHRVVNPDWAEGLGSSLCAGVSALQQLEPRLAELIVALADQPNLSPAHLERLRETRRRTSRAVVASECRGARMPPVLFAAEYFPRLLALRGDAGARGLLQAAGAALAVVPADDLVDLDTPADYEAFIRWA